MSRFRVGIASAAVTAAALTVGGCGGANTGTATTPEPTVAATATATVGVGLVDEGASMDDPKGDLVNEKGKKVDGPARVDVLKLTGSADGKDLRLILDVAGRVPQKLSSLDQETTYLFQIETDDSGDYDYWLMVGNQESGDWSPSLDDFAVGGPDSIASGPDFPGSMLVSDDTVMVTVSLAALADPWKVRVSVITQRADFKSGDVLAEDLVGMKKPYDPPSNKWLVLGGP